MTEATERSISALMMMKVMASATMIFSIDSWNRLIWFCSVRNCGTMAELTETVTIRMTSSRPSHVPSRDRIEGEAISFSLLRRRGV